MLKFNSFSKRWKGNVIVLNSAIFAINFIEKKKKKNLDFILNNLGEVDKVVQLQLQNGEEPSNSYYPLVPKRNLQKNSKLIILVSSFCSLPDRH